MKLPEVTEKRRARKRENRGNRGNRSNRTYSRFARTTIEVASLRIPLPQFVSDSDWHRTEHRKSASLHPPGFS